MEPRTCYMILETQTNERGEYIPCIAVEGASGYHLTDWAWGKDRAAAELIAKTMNREIGLTRTDVNEIIASTMRPTSKVA
jgi:hypothetical protein